MVCLFSFFLVLFELKREHNRQTRFILHLFSSFIILNSQEGSCSGCTVSCHRNFPSLHWKCWGLALDRLRGTSTGLVQLYELNNRSDLVWECDLHRLHFLMVEDGSRKGWLKNVSAEWGVRGAEVIMLNKAWSIFFCCILTVFSSPLTKVHPVFLIPLQQPKQKVTKLGGCLSWDAGRQQHGDINTFFIFCLGAVKNLHHQSATVSKT